MSNMSYCRFVNTFGDLEDCYHSMDEQDLSDSEKKYKERLINLCLDIAQDYGYEIGYEVNIDKA